MAPDGNSIELLERDDSAPYQLRKICVNVIRLPLS